MNFNSFTLIQHFLEFSAEKFPENIAVIHGNNRINFALLDKHVNSMANFLIKNNIEKRDRVGLLFKNSIEYIIAYFAILKAGGIAVPLNSEYSIKSLTYIINDCSIKGLICQKTNYKIIKNIGNIAYVVKYFCLNIDKPGKIDRKSTRLNSSHTDISRMPSSA